MEIQEAVMGRTPTDVEIEHARSLALRTARRRLGLEAHGGVDVDDVVQEVLLRFAQLDLAEVDNPDAWVVRVTANRCTDVQRASGHHGHVPIPGGSDGPAGAAEGGLRPEDLRIAMGSVGPSARAMGPLMIAHALAGLSEREKLLLLRHADGWGNAELAEELGYASAASVAVSISRAKSKVRARFASGPPRAELLQPQRVY
jgi:DNA-directed RNA polymerase specialized sigma24 family protein